MNQVNSSSSSNNAAAIILNEFRVLLDEFEVVSNNFSSGNNASSDQVVDCQLRVINYVADVLSCHSATQPLLVDAAVEAFEIVMTRRRVDDSLKINVAGVVMNLICADENPQLSTLATLLRLLLPVCEATGFVDDLPLQQRCAFIIGSLLDHPPFRQLSARILTEGFSTPLFDMDVFISNKAFTALSDSIMSSENFEPDSIFWLVALVKKHANLIITGPDLSFILSRLMRIASSAKNQPNQPQSICQCWRSILVGAIQLVEQQAGLSATSKGVEDVIISFEVVDELIERLRNADDLVAEAALRCLKVFCGGAGKKKLGEKFFALNCHITAFKYLTTEAIPLYLKMNFRHLLRPAFELLAMLTSGPVLPDSSVASESVLMSILDATRVVQDDAHLAVTCAANLLEMRFAMLPLVYEPVQALMRQLLENISSAGPPKPLLLASSCSLAAAIANTFDWPGLKAILAIPSSNTQIQVRFALLLIDFIRRLVISTCHVLLSLPFEALSWLRFCPIIDAMAVCIEKCHGNFIANSLFVEIHQKTPLLFNLLAFKSFLAANKSSSSSADTVMHAIIIDFASKQIDSWKRNASELSPEIVAKEIWNDPNELGPFLEASLPRLNEPMPKLVENFCKEPLVLLIAACSGVQTCATLLDRESFRQFLLVSFHQFETRNAGILLSHLVTSFLFKLDFTLLARDLELEIDAYLTNGQNKQAPLWFAIQPEFTTWCIRQTVVNGQPYLATRLIEHVLTSQEISISKWANFFVEILLRNFDSANFQPLAELFVAISFRLDEKSAGENWRTFTVSLFLGASQGKLDKLKAATLRACFDAISSSQNSGPIMAPRCPNALFLHLVTMSLCDSPEISAKFVEQEDRLVLASFLNRLVNISRPTGENSDAGDENELWLGVLNFLNAVLIIYFGGGAGRSLANLRNFALSLASNEALLNGLVFGITKQESNIAKKAFYASLVTVTWLWRFIPPGSTIKRDHVIAAKLFRPVSDHFLQDCSCSQNCCCTLPVGNNKFNNHQEDEPASDQEQEDDDDYCVGAMFASLILDKSRASTSWICADFAETLLLPRYMNDASKSSCSSSAIFKALLQLNSSPFLTKIHEALKEEEDPWLALSKFLPSKPISSENVSNPKPVVETVVVPVIVDGIVIAHHFR